MVKNVLAEDSVEEAERILEQSGGSVAMAVVFVAKSERDGVIGGADLTDIAGNRGNVSRARENRFRNAVGLALRPRVVEVEVQEGERVKVLAERRERVRRPRWSVPADSIEDLAEYLCKRLSYKQQLNLRREMIFRLEEEQK